ncbi:MAG: hypothetical protein ACRD29_13345 [Acidimicrobiales bacterium]
MSSDDTLPYPPDEPGDIEYLLGSFGSLATVLGEAGAATRSHASDLDAVWHGGASSAARAELGAIATLGDDASVAMTDVSAQVSTYFTELEAARNEIDLLRQEYDAELVGHRHRLARVSDLTTDAAEATAVRHDEHEAHQAALGDLRRRHEEIISALGDVAARARGELIGIAGRVSADPVGGGAGRH